LRRGDLSLPQLILEVDVLNKKYNIAPTLEEACLKILKILLKKEEKENKYLDFPLSALEAIIEEYQRTAHPDLHLAELARLEKLKEKSNNYMELIYTIHKLASITGISNPEEYYNLTLEEFEYIIKKVVEENKDVKRNTGKIN
jgi:hypothetical protein